ncbi:hypothetical protein TNCV_3800651 [Trichonephila clavipes]|nr:hypothetical protein TNCV_3800651 [Trichonephila clavipes]
MDQTFSIGKRSGKCAFPYQGRSVQCRQHAVVHYPAEKFAVDNIIEDALDCDEVLSRAGTMVHEMRVHSVTNIIGLFLQTLVVLQTTPILDTGLLTWLLDPLRSCG